MDTEQLGRKLIEMMPQKALEYLEGKKARRYFDGMRKKDSQSARLQYLSSKAGHIAIAVAAGGLLVFSSAMMYKGSDEISYVLERPAYGEGFRDENLRYSWQTEDGEAEGDISVPLPEKIPELNTAENVLDEKAGELEAIMLGVNESADLVDKTLNFENAPFENKNIYVTWQSDHPHLISDFGRIRNDDLTEPVEAVVHATMSYGQAEKAVEFSVTVLPKVLSDYERERWLEEHITEDENNIYLPEADGDVAWMTLASGAHPVKALLIVIAAIVMVTFLDDYELGKAISKRQTDMVRDLPRFLQRLSLLMHAGSTLPQAWKRICQDYEKIKEEGVSRPLYEEALAVMASYETGVPFSTCLFEMNRYCSQMEVSRMTLLLIQNIKKGNRMVIESMDQMNREIWKTHLELMKKQGELVSTKLILPMLLQLAVVLGIVLTPVMLSLNT